MHIGFLVYNGNYYYIICVIINVLVIYIFYGILVEYLLIYNILLFSLAIIIDFFILFCDFLVKY